MTGKTGPDNFDDAYHPDRAAELAAARVSAVGAANRVRAEPREPPPSVPPIECAPRGRMRVIAGHIEHYDVLLTE